VIQKHVIVVANTVKVVALLIVEGVWSRSSCGYEYTELDIST